MESVQSYNEDGWDYLTELKKFVAGGMTDQSFIDGVSGIVSRGCHNPPACGTGELDETARTRAEAFKKALDVFFGDSHISHVGPSTEYTGQYLCAQLRLAGSEWEKESVYTQLRDRNFKTIKDFLSANDEDGSYPLYV